MKDTDHQPGYYWVKYNGIWKIAELKNGIIPGSLIFKLNGILSEFYEFDFEDIDWSHPISPEPQKEVIIEEERTRAVKCLNRTIRFAQENISMYEKFKIEHPDYGSDFDVIIEMDKKEINACQKAISLLNLYNFQHSEPQKAVISDEEIFDKASKLTDKYINTGTIRMQEVLEIMGKWVRDTLQRPEPQKEVSDVYWVNIHHRSLYNKYKTKEEALQNKCKGLRYGYPYKTVKVLDEI